MGASASLLSDKIDEENLKELCGEMYTPAVYNFLKDSDGKVDRAQFLQIAMDVVEQEVFHLFTLYCEDGRMDEITLKVFFRNAKLLVKKHFDIFQAVELFRSVLPEGSSSIGYTTLRFELFPKVAEAKEMSLEKLLLRLSRSEEPVRQEVLLEGEKMVESVKSRFEFSPEEELARIKAAIKLQRASRPRQARLHVEKLKELKAFEAEVADYTELARTTHNGPNEIECELKFKTFLKHDDIRSQNTDMKMRDYLQLCYATNIIPVDVLTVNFTAADARHVFNLTTMKFFNKATGTFAEGVSVGKRISYGVFRNIVVPEIAKVAGKSTEEIVAMIASNNVVVPTIVSSHD